MEGPHIAADPKHILPFYLTREGQPLDETPYRRYILASFLLGDEPQFRAAGQQVEIDQAYTNGVTLVDARWGAAHPNRDRNSPAAAAGTSYWAILTWRVPQLATDLHAAVDLVDDAGHRLGSAENPLLPLGPGLRPVGAHLPPRACSAHAAARSSPS